MPLSRRSALARDGPCQYVEAQADTERVFDPFVSGSVVDNPPLAV